MGKWTPDYTDDVLHSKISTLVTGAIRRAAVEKESTITYEAFVNDLDIGDSFTTTLIDILVKEVADRRTRSTPNERRLLSERTVRSMRSLASTQRLYPGRYLQRNRSRRAINLSEYLTSAVHDTELDDAEDDMMDSTADATEGVRINTEMYDTFRPWNPVLPLSSYNSSIASNNAATTRDPAGATTAGRTSGDDPWLHPPPLSTTTVRRGSTGWSVVDSPPGPSLPPTARHARQNNRMVDIGEIVRRRARAMAVRAEAESSGDSSENNTNAHGTGSGPSNYNAATAAARRRLGFGRRGSSLLPAGSWPASLSYEPMSVGEWFVDGGLSSNPAAGTSAASDPPLAPHQPESNSMRDDEWLVRAPRLRRGGVRVPEVVMSRSTSPPVSNAATTGGGDAASTSAPTSEAARRRLSDIRRVVLSWEGNNPSGATSTTPTPTAETPLARDTPFAPPSGDNAPSPTAAPGPTTSIEEPAVSYPTPGGSEPENPS